MASPKKEFSPDPLIVIILDKFLDWVQAHRAPKTCRWYKDSLQGRAK
jgi:hypothetical protein